MRWGRFSILVATGAAVALPSPALALIDQTWVAEEGLDAGGCQAISPCATLAYAITQTMAGGTVIVSGSGYYGSATIDRSLTIRGEYGTPTIIASLTIAAGTTDRVVLDNLFIQCKGAARGVAYGTGVAITQAYDVLMKGVTVKDCAASSGVAAGVYLNVSAQSRLTMYDCAIFNNTVGVWITGAAGKAHLKMFRSLVLGNPESGVRIVGSGNDVFLSDNSMLGSVKGLDLQSGGLSKSFGNNALTSGDVPVALPLY
jgi:nitrous oxidase accessory protein NosD